MDISILFRLIGRARSGLVLNDLLVIYIVVCILCVVQPDLLLHRLIICVLK